MLRSGWDRDGGGEEKAKACSGGCDCLTKQPRLALFVAAGVQPEGPGSGQLDVGAGGGGAASAGRR